MLISPGHFALLFCAKAGDCLRWTPGVGGLVMASGDWCLGVMFLDWGVGGSGECGGCSFLESVVVETVGFFAVVACCGFLELVDKI